jgi:short-subunit dehydrogenase
VVLNNAGYGLAGPFEAAIPAQIRRQFDTNVFGLMEVTRAFLPHFRASKAGMFINVSSAYLWLTATPLSEQTQKD